MAVYHLRDCKVLLVMSLTHIDTDTDTDIY